MWLLGVQTTIGGVLSSMLFFPLLMLRSPSPAAMLDGSAWGSSVFIGRLWLLEHGCLDASALPGPLRCLCEVLPLAPWTRRGAKPAGTDPRAALRPGGCEHGHFGNLPSIGHGLLLTVWSSLEGPGTDLWDLAICRAPLYAHHAVQNPLRPKTNCDRLGPPLTAVRGQCRSQGPASWERRPSVPLQLSHAGQPGPSRWLFFFSSPDRHCLPFFPSTNLTLLSRPPGGVARIFIKLAGPAPPPGLASLCSCRPCPGAAVLNPR